jgi:hypothetical protein
MIYPGLPDDPSVLAAIGTIALRHGQLDNALKMAVGSLTGVSIDEAVDASEGQVSGELTSRVRGLAKKRLVTVMC